MPQSNGTFADDLASIRNPTPSAGSFADDLRIADVGYSVSPDVGALIGSAGAPLHKPPSPTTFQPPPPPERNFDVDQKTGQRVTPVPLGQVPVLDAPAAGIPQAARGAKNLVTDPSIGAANDVIEGLFKTAEPLMAGAAIANPLLTGQMVLRSFIASKFGEDVAGSVGASPEGKRLSGNVAALLSGGLGVKKFAEKVAADARAVAEQVRAYDAANPRPAPPETINVGRGATPAAAAERVPTPKPAPSESFAGDLDLIRPPEPVAPVEPPPVVAERTPIGVQPEPAAPPPEPVAEPKISADMRKILRKQGFSDATIDKMEQDQRVSVEAGDSREKVITPTPIVPRGTPAPEPEPQIAAPVVEEPEIAPVEPPQPVEKPSENENLATPPPVVENVAKQTEDTVSVLGSNGLADQLDRIESRVDRLTMRGAISESELEQIEALTDRIEQQIGTRKEVPAAEAAKMGDELKAALQSLRPARRAQLAAAPKDVNDTSNLPGEPLDAATPAASAQVDEGAIAPRGEDQRPAPDESGLLSPGRREGGAPQRRAVGRTIKPDASADNDTLNELVARAVAGGYRGDTSTLRTDLTERLQALRDIDSEFEDSGRNPITLLKAIAKLGGISEAKETGQKGEIKRLKEFRDQQASQRIVTSRSGEKKLRGRPGALITMDSIRGVRGIFRADGLPLDDIVSRLKQDPEFSHIETIEDLTHEIEAAASDQSDALSAKRFVKGLGEKYWENVSEPVEQPAGEDVNEFGEIQPRLPEAGMVREQNIDTPEFDVPFSLEAEIDKQFAKEGELFDREPGADDEDESTLSRFLREEEGSVPVPDDLVTIANGMRQIAGEVAAVIAPQSRSPEAQRAADIVRKAQAAAANAGTVERMKANKRYGIGPSKGAESAFGKGGKDKAVADISAYERTGKFPAIQGLDPGYSQLYQDSQLASLILYRYAYGADQVGYVENRVARMFRFPDRASQAKGEAFLNANARKLSADRGPTRSRVLDMPLDQALAQMKARGINVEMASWNPETIRQWDLANARLAAAMRDAWTDLKDGGLVTWVPQGQRAPSGLQAIHERGAKFFYPRERGQGNYYADENVARVLNNVVSEGFAMKATVNGIMKANAALNQLQLGFSAFHAMGTAIHGAAADAHIAVRRLMGGTPSESVLPALRAMVPGVSLARDIYRGRRFVEDLKRDDPAAWDVLEHKLNPGGVRLQMQQDYRTDMIQKMAEAWREGSPAKAALRLPLAVVEAVAKPLMDYAIPRVKLAVALDRMAEVDRRMPNATPEQKARAYAAASDQIDNKFGLLVYDNGFWKKTHRQAAHSTTRSVGWTGGTLRWGVGTAADMGNVAKDLGTGKHPDISDRMIDAFVYPLVAAYLGAVYMYLSTGKKPKSAKDLYYPENGRTTANGKPSRTVLPTYMKDVYAYSQDPTTTLLQKQSPGLESAYDLFKNEDYFGVLIADPDDPKAKQWEDRGRYILKNAMPFSLTQGERISREGGGTRGKVEAFLGLTPASAAISRTPFERYLHDLVPPAHLNHEQAERAQARRDVRALAQGGHIDEAVKSARAAGMSAGSIRATLKTAREGVTKAQFERLTWSQAANGYALAEPEERKPLWPSLARKVGPAQAAAPDRAAREKVLEMYRDLRKLPREEAAPKYMAPSLMPAAQGATAP